MNLAALRLKDAGKYLLNGNFMVMHRKVIVQSGVTMEYSGPEPVVERLNSSRPILVDLILEVISDEYSINIIMESTRKEFTPITIFVLRFSQWATLIRRRSPTSI